MKRFLLTLVALTLFSLAAVAQNTTTKEASKESSAATTTKSVRFTPNKTQIEAGQKFLKEKKLYTGEADGKYNAETRAAIRVYQKENEMDISGNFNRATLEKMGIALTDKQKGAETSSTVSADKKTDAKMSKSTDSKSSTETMTTTPPSPKRPAPFQANKEQIASLQTTLKEAKLFTGNADGERSDELKEAIKKYQEANDLKATGGINAATLEKAGIALTDKQKEQVAAQAAYDAANKKN